MITAVLIGSAVASFGLLFLFLGLRQIKPDRSFDARGVHARALCTAVTWRGTEAVDGERETFAYPVFRFRTDDGRRIESESPLGRRPAAARVGSEYDVVYDRADPMRVQIVGGAGAVGALTGAVFVTMGVVFALVGIAIAVLGSLAAG